MGGTSGTVAGGGHKRGSDGQRGITNIYYSAPIDVFWTTVNNQICVEKVPIKSLLVLNVGFIQPRFS